MLLALNTVALVPVVLKEEGERGRERRRGRGRKATIRQLTVSESTINDIPG